MNIIYKRFSISIVIANVLMNSIKLNCGDFFREDEFCKRFNALYDYVNDKYDSLLDTDIIDMYIVCEQMSPTNQ